MSGAGSLRRRLDRYELLAEIARGGMGSVLLARLGGAGGFERLFAVKVMHPELTGSPQFVRMLLEEARLAAKIHHPNVVATVDVRQHEDFHYIVMDYVDGFPLARVLDDAPFSWKERVRIVNRALLDVLAGLGAAHDLRGDDGVPLGLVHRDVSPQNILLGTDGVGRLSDFGIARASRASAARGEVVRGKPSYLAPEQANETDVDLRADLWALGVILWEALTGLRLFSAEDEASTIAKVVSEPVESPAAHRPEVPTDLEALCLRALDRDPTRRHRSAREMALELERVAKRSGLLADAHEVSDLLRERFGSETERRRRAIQRYVAALGDETSPVESQDIYDLPKLAEDAAPASGRWAGARPPVGLATMPASRFLRTTPSGTSSESLPPKPRRLAGFLGLLVLFALGSLTTLFMIRTRMLPDFVPLSLEAPLAAVGEPPRAEVAAQPEGALYMEAAPPEPAVAEGALEAAPPEPAVAEGALEAAPPEPAAELAQPAEAELSRTPAAGAELVRVSGAQPVSSSAALAITPPVPASAAALPRRVKPRPAPKAETPAPAPALPVEENPYRFK